MKLIDIILDRIFNSEITEKIASIGGGTTASLLTFVNTGFGDFAVKCIAAAAFAMIGGVMGYAGKKLGEYLFNKYKNRKNAKRN